MLRILLQYIFVNKINYFWILFLKEYTGVLDLKYSSIKFVIPKLTTHVISFYAIMKLFLQWI